MKLKWTTVKKKVNDLIPLEINPRKISEVQRMKLIESLQKFNLVDLPVVDTDNTVVSGHQRLRALQAIGRGEEEIDVRIPNRKLSEREIKEYNLISNSHAGEWDTELFEEFFSDLDLTDIGFDLDAAIFGEIEDAKKEVAEPEAEEDNYKSPADILVDVIKGDLIEIGRHRLICGDSREADVVEKVLNNALPVLMVTDPPYGVEYDPSWREKARGGKIKSTEKVQNDHITDWSESYSLFPGDVAYVWHPGIYSHLFAQSIIDCGFELKYLIVWNKNTSALSRGDYHHKHEPCWYAVKKGKRHNWQGSRKEHTVWDIANLSSRKVIDREGQTGHATQKPIACMAKPIKNNSAQGDSIYDPFLGSGSTMVACHQLNRICYGIELKPLCCQMVINRMHKLDANLPIKINGKLYHPTDAI